MSIESALLLLESTLLLATLVLLVASIKESRQRNSLMLEVSKATKTLTRMEYFQAVVDSMNEAEKEIIGVVTGHRLNGIDDEQRIKNILTVIEKAVGRGVVVRFLLPRFHDRLYMGYLYTKAGAEVRYSTCSMVYSIRYNVVDSRLVVIGIPEAASEEASTNKGHRLPSEALAYIMHEHFYGCWGKNTNFQEYLEQVMEQSGASIETLSQETGLAAGTLKNLLPGSPRTTRL
jgi:hypothetical protein